MVDRQLPGGECFSEYFKVSRLPKLHCGSSRQLHWWGGAGGALDSGEEKEPYLMKGVIIPPISLAWLMVAYLPETSPKGPISALATFISPWYHANRCSGHAVPEQKVSGESALRR